MRCVTRKRMINGSHHHYPVAGIGEALQCEGLTADNAGYKSQHLASDVPTVATTEPATNGSIPFLTRRRIAQHFMFKTLPQGFHHKRGVRKSISATHMGGGHRVPIHSSHRPISRSRYHGALLLHQNCKSFACLFIVVSLIQRINCLVFIPPEREFTTI